MTKYTLHMLTTPKIAQISLWYNQHDVENEQFLLIGA